MATFLWVLFCEIFGIAFSWKGRQLIHRELIWHIKLCYSFSLKQNSPIPGYLPFTEQSIEHGVETGITRQKYIYIVVSALRHQKKDENFDKID